MAGDPNATPAPGLFDPTFLSSLRPALPVLEEKGVKLAVNAGASDAELLARDVKGTIKDLGLNLKVAWIEGDEVMDQVMALKKKGGSFPSLVDGRGLDEWGYEPIYAQYCLPSLPLSNLLTS